MCHKDGKGGYEMHNDKRRGNSIYLTKQAILNSSTSRLSTETHLDVNILH